MKVLAKNISKATKTVVKYSALFIFKLLGLLLSMISFFFSSIFIRFFRKYLLSKS